MLIGRGSELARIGQLLAEARLGTSGVLVIAGEPGVGKTALLRHAVEEARGMTVLQAKGVESEAELPFAGLYALLRPAFDRLDALPPRQAAALKGALGLSPGVESDRFLIGAATLSLLASLAEHAPVLLVIDDAQWIDESSLARGPVRRPAPVRRRAGAGDRHPPGHGDRASDDRPARAGPRIRRARARAPGRRPARARHRGAHLRGDARQPAGPRRAGRDRPRRAHAAGDDGRARLREPDRQAARCRAPPAGARGGRGPRRARRARPRGGASWSRARRPRARRTRRPRVGRRRPVRVSAIPLARSAAYRSTSSDERRAAHGALASADPDPDRQAWHAAGAALGPDDETAQALEDAGRRARSRGAYTAAASSFERAARLHPGRRRARAPAVCRRRRGLARGPHRAGPAATRGGARAHATTPRCDPRSTSSAGTPSCAPGA